MRWLVLCQCMYVVSVNCLNLPEGGDGDSNSLSVWLLKFSHLSCLLDTEVDLVAVLAHDLQLDVLSVVLAHDGVCLNAELVLSRWRLARKWSSLSRWANASQTPAREPRNHLFSRILGPGARESVERALAPRPRSLGQRKPGQARRGRACDGRECGPSLLVHWLGERSRLVEYSRRSLDSIGF